MLGFLHHHQPTNFDMPKYMNDDGVKTAMPLNPLCMEHGAQFDVVTLFPEMFAALTEWGISGRAAKQGRYQLRTWNPRDFSDNAHRTIDDRPYGGGPGMVMQAPPLERAITAAKAAQRTQHVELECATSPAGVKRSALQPRVILMSPQGTQLTHKEVMRLAAQPALILICGRYEALDQRFIERCVDEEISLGDFVLSGGELAAMTLMDALIRQWPGVLGDAQSAMQDSFVDGLLDCPHYTRPREYEGLSVPEVLLEGNHAVIQAWRRRQSLLQTYKRRPDLIDMARKQGRLSADDQTWLAKIEPALNDPL